MGARCDEGLHPGIERALTRAGPNLAARARARRSLGVLLEWTRRAPAPWASSTLTMHGAPIEFGFGSADKDLRCSVEIADPQSPRRGRVRQARAVLQRLGGELADAAMMQRLERLQERGGLRFGAWLGGRHSAAGDRYKLYVEVPPEGAAAAERWSKELIGPLPLPCSHACRIGLVGYDCGSGRVEFYYQARRLLPTAVAVLLRRAGMASRSAEVLALLEALDRFSSPGRLPSRDVGFSYSVPAGGDASGNGGVVVSIYFFCLALFGGDGRARRRILQLAAAQGWTLPEYETLSEPLAASAGVPTRHGMFGVVLRHGAAAGITVGLAPPGIGCAA